MGKWSDEAREIRAELHRWRMEEACEGIQHVLLKGDHTDPLHCIPKESLYEKTTSQCYRNRRATGVNVIPTIENKEVKEIDENFLSDNWSDLCIMLAEEYKFFVCFKSGRGGGIYKGDRDAYHENQTPRQRVIEGSANRFNVRSDIINDNGGKSIKLNIAELPSGERS